MLFYLITVCGHKYRSLNSNVHLMLFVDYVASSHRHIITVNKTSRLFINLFVYHLMFMKNTSTRAIKIPI